jgi:hypothetical protein
MNFDLDSLLVITKILGVIVMVISVLLKIIAYYLGDSNFSDSGNQKSDYRSLNFDVASRPEPSA